MCWQCAQAELNEEIVDLTRALDLATANISQDAAVVEAAAATQQVPMLSYPLSFLTPSSLFFYFFLFFFPVGCYLETHCTINAAFVLWATQLDQVRVHSDEFATGTARRVVLW